jgi:beta-phosphoglucomutase-like phosphatase (HAD superfamily)
VSNNSGTAVRAYLAAHKLADQITAVVSRDNPDPYLMKPNPYLVRAAVGLLDSTGGECVFVGDSPSDVLAGRLGGVMVIGYANKPGKADALAQAGADAVTARLSEISAALHAAPRACNGAALPN